ncbi:glycosyltransferase involved in cell wall biosynthesis [Mucilaginibacter yixingensis]|uniref:Glycosyltransferase involved in cell wall biosynthesis n=1 Tax=Mucilaginibacter yixingensis TaxID=1295612 RepID=A0A2T5JGR5_9SPHI|nr:glycosyltransferase family 4 protein [Mucilaginibacter yixingensis]PTR01591.1 glycosyltransferase involved in cell wall biosynthesis [Mucilaginibacter yixingensis]
MNILFLTLVKINDVAERNIYTDLIRVFSNNGHQVCIVSPVERRYKKPTAVFTSGNVRILNVKTLNIQKTNFLEKGIGTLLVEKQFEKAIKKHYSQIKFDLVLYSTPPITFTNVVKFIKNRDKAVSYLLLKDIFPQNAVDLDMIKKDGILHRFFKQKEKQLYDISDYIGCMSPANVRFITDHNAVDPKKIEVNPNSIEPLEINVSDEEKKHIKADYNIPLDAVTFIYGGNLGKPQGIDFLINVLKTNAGRKGLFFVIIGQGTEYPKLHAWVTSNKADNVLLLQSLPKKDYDVLLSSCDVGLIFLDKRFTIPNFPSRLLSYLENKMPVLAATDSNTDVGEVITENNIGIWCLSGNIDEFNEALLYLQINSAARHTMGTNGYDFMLKNYLVEQSYQTIMKHLKNV